MDPHCLIYFGLSFKAIVANYDAKVQFWVYCLVTAVNGLVLKGPALEPSTRDY